MSVKNTIGRYMADTTNQSTLFTILCADSVSDRSVTHQQWPSEISLSVTIELLEILLC